MTDGPSSISRRGFTRTLGAVGVALDVDPSEQANLAKKRPGDLASLRTAWESVNAELLPY